MTRIFLSIAVYLLTFISLHATVWNIGDIPNVHLTDSTRHVVDPDNLLSPENRRQIDAMIQNLWERTSSEMSVVVIDSMAIDDIDTFATELFTKWGIGKSDNDNGLLMLVAIGQHKIAIRTGYGMEGVVPDIIAGRIIRNIATPRFRQGDIDGGVYESVTTLTDIITDPEASKELKSKLANNSNIATDITSDDVLQWWIWLSIITTCVMTAIYLYYLISTRHRDQYEQYHTLRDLLIPYAVASAVCLGMPLIILLIVYITMRRVRTRPRICANCMHKMHRLDEVKDNEYLTPAQDTEERINSVDYDVWLCDNCGETDILPYVNKSTSYKECSHCHARAAELRSDRIISSPTTSREGYGVKTYICKNCHQPTNVTYKIPRKEQPAIVILPPGGGGSSGGFGGGSFGGGMTGGGGASGSW